MRPWRLARISFLPRSVNLTRQLSTVIQSPLASLLSNGTTLTGSQIQVNGFVRSVRRQKRVAFAAIGDGSTLEPLQAVMTPEDADGLSTGTSVSIVGEWQASPAGKKQAHELHVHKITILGDNDSTTYPIQKKYHTAEFLRTVPHLRPRLPYNSLLLHLRSQVISDVTSFFVKQDFVQTHPPIITSSDCEGAGEVFTVNTEGGQSRQGVTSSAAEQFFRSPKYLTVSTQLHLEALAQAVGKVWTLSPTFRAEKSDTTRHLSEFYMLEAEICFTDNLNHIMDVVEGMLREIATNLSTSRVGSQLLSATSLSQDPQEIQPLVDLKKRWDGFIAAGWPRISYTAAIARLEDAVLAGKVKFEFPPDWKSGLQAEHEKYLAHDVGNDGPVFVTDYPREIKAFYMAPSMGSTAGSPATVACFDLLVPDVCELVGGSMREHRLQHLLQSMNSRGLHQENDSNTLQDKHPDNHSSSSDVPLDLASESIAGEHGSLGWYTDLRRYGSVPHGGFGLGFDRLLSYLAGVSNIREVVAFPRWYGRCDC